MPNVYIQSEQSFAKRFIIFDSFGLSNFIWLTVYNVYTIGLKRTPKKSFVPFVFLNIILIIAGRSNILVYLYDQCFNACFNPPPPLPPSPPNISKS